MHSVKTSHLLRAVIVSVVLAAVHASAAAATKPDAVIERWEQHWTVGADGSITEHVIKHIQLNHPRAYDDVADYRITYDTATQELDIIAARTKLPDGSYREMPEYGHVLVSPNVSAGWPVLASLQQHVLVMSGVMPGCVLEIEYRLTTKPGARRYLTIDQRLDAEWTVKQRAVTISVPDGTPLQAFVTSGKAGSRESRSIVEGNDARYAGRNLPALPDESHALPWQEGGMRLVATTIAPEQWLQDRLGQIDTAGQVTARLRELAEEWTADATTLAQQLDALHAGINERYHEVAVPASWRPAAVRSAGEVLASAHGLPAESCALLLAGARALNLEARPAMLAQVTVFDHNAPQESMIAAYPIVVRVSGEWQLWDVPHGRIERDAQWGGHAAIFQDGAKLEHLLLSGWDGTKDSRCQVSGTLEVDDAGALRGTLHVEQTGLFVSRPTLLDESGQRRHLQTVVDHVLPALNVDSFTVTQLGAGQFAATVAVNSGGALEELHDAHQLVFAERGPYAAAFELPLSNATRLRPCADWRRPDRGGLEDLVAGELAGAGTAGRVATTRR
jgi:hypothetical protein